MGGLAAVLAAVLIATVSLSGEAALVQPGEDRIVDYQAWSDRLSAAAKRHDAFDQVLCITTLGRRWNWSLKTLPARTIEQAALESELARVGPSRIEMLQMLYEVRWLRADGSEPSRWWRQLSLNLLENSRAEESFAVAAHITDPYVLIALQADDRYRRIAKSSFVEGDIPRAARNELKRRQDAASARAGDLSRVVQVGRALLALHRHDDVLRLTAPLLESPPSTLHYDDLSRQWPWILDIRARAFAASGHYEEALALLRRAAEESKADRVSHALNLANFLTVLNQPQAALTAMPPLEEASSYGRAVAASVRVKAAAELGDPAALQAALDDLLANTQQYPAVRQRALIVAGKEDEAAATLLARLADPDERTDALVELQHYLDDPAPARTTEWRAREQAVRDRPEVRQAIDRYGRIRSYPLPGIGF